ncbi:MAG TPA: AMP-binding protein [Acidimicrobiales bacterium]|jgi:acyl-CoA synthetase (AMP-forming)/AMP-acid ligase II|nr:AMP-binding protein [Acidimicrobiales bacterium]
MHVQVDLGTGAVSLADPDNFKAFHVTAAGQGDDDAVGDRLREIGAGRRSERVNHVWVAEAWLRNAAVGAGVGKDWTTGFEQMLGFAAKMGWIDDSGQFIHAHTEWPLFDGRDLWELIDRRVAATPDLEMMCDETGGRITFGEFAARAEAVAAGVLAHGVRRGDVVSWILPSWFDAVVLSAALNRIEVVQNPIIPIYREREVAFCTRQAAARVLVVPGTWRGFDYTAMAQTIAANGDGLDVLVAPRGGLPVGDPSTLPARAAPPATPEDSPVRWLCYTSGTTSDPKGARHTDPSIAHVARAMAERLDCRHGDRSAIAFPYTHIGGITWLFAAMQTGVVLLLDEAFDPKRTPQYLAQERCTHAGSGTPFHLAYLAAQRAHPDVPLFPRLKNCPGGGSPKPPQLHYDVKRELGGAGVVSGWGLTEVPILTTARWKDPDEKLANTEGFAMPGVELIAVKNDGTRAEPGEEGELRAKAPQMMKGYLDSSLDVDAFDEHGYFRTGDLGIIDEDGYVVITGRLKDIIIRNAENISAKEVEDLLYTHPKVHDVAVIGLPDPKTGERVCAVVAPAEGQAPLEFVEMQTFLRSLGIRNQAIPEQLELIDAVPRNASGKITKNVLRDRYRDVPST